MPGLAALIAALVVYYVFFKDRSWLSSPRLRQAVRRWGGAAFLVLALLASLTGRFVPAAGLVLIGFALIGFTAGARIGQQGPQSSTGKNPAPDLDRAEALAVLGLSEGASEADIQEAYRRLIVKVHPDHGGTADLAARLNRARDILLASDTRR